MNTPYYKNGMLPSKIERPRRKRETEASKRRKRPMTKVKELWRQQGQGKSLREWAKTSKLEIVKDWLARKS